MNKRKLRVFLLIFYLSEFFYGCCGENGYIRKEAIVERQIPPAIFWNQSEKILEVFVIRGNGSGMINFMINPNDFRRQPFSETGYYRYYIKAYEIIENTDTRRFVGEIHGAFNIIIGKTKNYKNNSAGMHIVIKEKSIRHRKEASLNIFGDKNFVGITEHKKHSEKITVRNSASEASAKFTGGFGLLLKLLKNK